MKKFIISIILLVCSNVYGDESCFDEAAIYYNIPVALLRCIAQNESSMKPYAVNILGQSYYPDNKSEALRLIDMDKTFDVGIMQINQWWFDKYGYNYELGLDACWNIKMGAYILAYEVSRYGYNWDAIGRYHSPTEKNRKAYIHKLVQCMSK